MSAEWPSSELTVAVLPLGQISTQQIKLTTMILDVVFGVKTTILPQTEVPSQYFNAERKRYQGSQILDFLFFQLPPNAQRIIGIVEGGLENADTISCSGIANLYQRVALYSVPHLSEQSDLSEKQFGQDLISLFLITHEFSHTLGIPHCDQLDCAMNQTKYSVIMCARCRLWAKRELKVKPGSAEERFSYAEILFMHNRFAQAIAAYRQAILRAPKEPLYYHRLGAALHYAGQFDMANKEWGQALWFSDDLPNGYYNLGLAHLRSGSEQAKDFFNKAIAAANDPKFMHRLVGQAYREILHDVEMASQHYQEYLRLGGDDPDIVDWLVSRSKLDKP